MKIIKKTCIALLSTLLIILFLNFVLNIWVAIKLETLFSANNNAPFVVKYKKLDISLLSKSLAVNEISLVPKIDTVESTTNLSLNAKIKRVELSAINIIEVLFYDKIKAKYLEINNPKITLITNENKDKSATENVLKSLKNTFQLSTVDLKNATINILNKKGEKALFKAHNLSVTINDVLLSNKTIDNKIPFNFKKYSLKCDSIYYNAGAFYTIKTKHISVTNSAVNIKDFKLKPTVKRKEFVSKIVMETDLFDINSKNISIKNMKWEFKDSVFIFDTRVLEIDSLSALVYRNKEPKDDMSRKKLYGEILRNLKFNLKIDSLKIKNSSLIYEEELTFKKGAGTLFFDDFNLIATNIKSGLMKSKNSNLNIKINCNFMKTSPLRLNWNLNLADVTDSFKIDGKIEKLNLEKLNLFTKPYINVKTEGVFDKVLFNFTGNNSSSKGKLALEYDNLEVKIFKKNNPKKKNKLLTAIGNLFVKKDSKDKLKSADVNVERVQEKSFYNFLWLNIAEGLKKILI